MAARGHEILFLERDKPWYAAHRDLMAPPYCALRLYADLAELSDLAPELAQADAVILGSFVPDGVSVARWALRAASGVVAFYDVDTPVTLAKLAAGDREYLAPELIPAFDLYLSFTGGPALRLLEQHYGAPAARPLFCSVDPEQYHPTGEAFHWDLGYLGTYSSDRQPALERLLIEPARRTPDCRFVVAGPLYPADIEWPANVERIDHLGPAEHAAFYSRSRWTLNVTRADMVAQGHSPSVRLFEAAACGTPILSDRWPGLDEILDPGREIVIADDSEAVLRALDLPERERARIAAAGRARVLASHTARHRAAELERHLTEAITRRFAGSPARHASRRELT
jgi:spore maturation protein CgeB